MTLTKVSNFKIYLVLDYKMKLTNTLLYIKLNIV